LLSLVRVDLARLLAFVPVSFFLFSFFDELAQVGHLFGGYLFVPEQMGDEAGNRRIEDANEEIASSSGGYGVAGVNRSKDESAFMSFVRDHALGFELTKQGLDGTVCYRGFATAIQLIGNVAGGRLDTRPKNLHNSHLHFAQPGGGLPA
jgi:hypothetical protein